MASNSSKSQKPFPAPPRDEDVAMVVLESTSYQEFDQWMDVELERLVARWIDSAAPNAGRMSLLQARGSK